MRFHFIPISWCGCHTVVLAAGRGLGQVVFLSGHHGGVWIGRIDVGDPGLSQGILAFHPEVLLGTYLLVGQILGSLAFGRGARSTTLP